MFYDNYVNICRQLNVRHTIPVRDLGMSTGAISGWKAGGEPSTRTRKAIADYLGITLEELDAGQIKKAPTVSNDDERDLKIYRELVKDLDSEQMQEVRNYIDYLKARKLNNQ